MDDSKYSKKKKEHIKSKTKSYQPRNKTIRKNTPEITDKSIQKVIYGWLDTKLGQFMKEKLEASFKKKKQKSCRPRRNTP